MKRFCIICKSQMDYLNQDDFLEKGYQKFTFGNEKWRFVCEKHSSKEISKLVIEMVKK